MENITWDVVNDKEEERSSSGRPVGCPPAADEPSLAKRPVEQEVIECDLDDHMQLIVNFGDTCEDVETIDYQENITCQYADAADMFEIFVANLISDIHAHEKHQANLFEEEMVGENDCTVNAEEEKVDTPPSKFDDLEHMIMALDDNDQQEENLNIVEKIRKRLAGMLRVRKGLTVDSGAADHVMPIGWLPAILFAIVQSIGSRMGLHYVAADGTIIPNVGQQHVKFMTTEGTWMGILFQLAAINKPLVSVSKLIEDGYQVIFDDAGSYILHKKTKNIVRMRKQKGVFVIDCYVNKPAEPTEGFSRPR